MSDKSFTRFLRTIKTAFLPTEPTAKVAPKPTSTPTPTPSVAELISEGLRQRQLLGTAAAQPYFEKAAHLEPNSHIPWFMLGNVASELGDLDSAVAHYSRARDLQPTDHVIHYNLGLNQLWRGYIDFAIEELRAACDLSPSYAQAQSSCIMAMHSSYWIAPEEIATAAREWGARFCLQHAPVPQRARVASTDSQQLRIGFLSGDLRAHSVAHFLEPILGLRDRNSFAYTLYNNSQGGDEVTARMREYADGWRDVWQLSDDALVERIREDQIDVLVDLSGHTASNRLAVFAKGAAPVQVTYLGYPSSTGLATMDFRVTDVLTDPPMPADAWHCERLLRMPDTQWCFRPFGAPPTPGPLPAYRAGFVTFGSFNNMSKVGDTLLNCWIQILKKLPTAHLRLARIRSAQRAAEIVSLFERGGVATDRIECVAYASEPLYGRQFNGVDIALDSYPYNGVTTTCESLYVGVPVVSLYGRNGVSRSGLSILTALGLSDLAAPDPARYVEIAAELGNDLPRLEHLRASLRNRIEQSPLRDEKRFAANFERLLLEAWRQRRQPN